VRAWLAAVLAGPPSISSPTTRSRTSSSTWPRSIARRPGSPSSRWSARSWTARP